MRNFLSQQWKFVLLLTSLVLWLSCFPLWAQWVTENPLDTVITLAPKGVIEEEVHIVVPENYELNLVFERAGLPYERLKSLLGDWAYKEDGKPIPSGIKIPIRWSLQKSNSEIVASGQVESFGSIAWSAAEVERKVDHIKVEPGKYIFTAEILRDVPEFSGIKSRISMQLRPKASSTWQITLVW